MRFSVVGFLLTFTDLNDVVVEPISYSTFYSHQIYLLSWRKILIIIEICISKWKRLWYMFNWFCLVKAVFDSVTLMLSFWPMNMKFIEFVISIEIGRSSSIIVITDYYRPIMLSWKLPSLSELKVEVCWMSSWQFRSSIFSGMEEGNHLQCKYACPWHEAM